LTCDRLLRKMRGLAVGHFDCMSGPAAVTGTSNKKQGVSQLKHALNEHSSLGNTLTHVVHTRRRQQTVASATGRARLKCMFECADWGG
jgi:hypothetical protein